MARDKKTALHQAAKILGKKGGKAGGPARAKAISAGRRRAIAAQGGAATKGMSKS